MDEAQEARIELQILKATETVHKTYDFDNDHMKTRPIDVFFQESHEGTVLFVIFYTMACRYSACMGCNLPALASLHHVDYRFLMQQVDHLFGMPAVMERADEIRKVIVSNQGSVLDEMTFSSTALMYLLARVNLHLPHVRVFCLETRPEYIDEAELEFLARAMREARDPQATIELALGFEVFDDEIRNRVFRKGLSLETFESVVQMCARHNFTVKCYFMQKPVPSMSDDDAIVDVQNALAYLAKLSSKHGARLSMHLNPTYAARGTDLEVAFRSGTFAPPKLLDVARAVTAARDTPVPVFIGLNDEDMAVQGGSFIRAGEEAIQQALERFNRTQDFSILDALIAQGGN